MEALLILVFLVFVILILAGNSKSRRHLLDIHSELEALRNDLREFLIQSRLEIRQIRSAPASLSTAAPKPVPAPMPPAPPPPQPKPEPVPIPDLPKPGQPLTPPVRPEPEPELPKPQPEPLPDFKPLPEPAPEPATKETRDELPAPVPDPPRSLNLADRSQTPMPEPARTDPPPPPAAPPPEPRPGFFERHPDLEKFIGENLIPKIGIAILVLGIGFFVKYAIDQNWIKPAGRVAIGMLCGGILIGIAHRLQRVYKAFSSVLVGGGLAVCYYSIALAYQDYGLISQPLAFVVMAALTAFAAVLSLLYDRQEVAIIAMAGGFTAPFLVSNGSGNYEVLFSYLIVLNAGLLIIAYRKAWRLLNGLAFGLTALLFAGWLATLGSGTPAQVYRGGFFFGAAFYLLFLAINLAHNVSRSKSFIASDFSILLAATGLFFGGGIHMLEHGGWTAGKGAFAIALALVNFAVTAFLVRRGRVDKSILYLFIGLTLSFVSMTAPLQLSGHSITLFWAAETVVVLWLYLRTRYRILEIGFGIVWFATWVSLIMDWNKYFFSVDGFPIVFNRGFLTSMYVVAAHAVMAALCRQQQDPDRDRVPGYVVPLAGTAALVLCFVTGYAETWLQLSARTSNHHVLPQYLLAYTLAFIAALGLLRKRLLPDVPPPVLAVLSAFGVLSYLGCSLSVFDEQISLWQSYGRWSHFCAHWLAAVLTAYLSLRLIRTLRNGVLGKQRRGTDVFPAIFGLLFVSMEAALLARVLFASDVAHIPAVDSNYIRIGLPIVWGLYSFVLMWLGMRGGRKALRITSLSIFCITLLKLFLVDIRLLGPGGRIAAFCSLGVLLLIISFMYQRLRRLIVDDKPHEETPGNAE